MKEKGRSDMTEYNPCPCWESHQSSNPWKLTLVAELPYLLIFKLTDNEYTQNFGAEICWKVITLYSKSEIKAKCLSAVVSLCVCKPWEK